MPSLTDRLHQTKAPVTTRPSGERRDGLAVHVPGELLVTPFGPCYCVRWSCDATGRHGALPLAATLGPPARALGGLLKEPAPVALDWEQVLFLDTETTGLAGGTGTSVFLVGVGTVRGRALRHRQLFLRDELEEPALPAARAAAVVSF